jgi:hypothetical protein
LCTSRDRSVSATWIGDLNGGVVEVAVDPSEQGYGRLWQAGRGDKLTPTAFPDLTIPVADLLGLT